MLDPDLMEALEVASMDAIAGDAPGPAVAKRLERDLSQVLKAHGLPGCTVRASSGRRGTFVQILLRRPDKTVQEIKLRLT